jgi:hypothetical protein
VRFGTVGGLLAGSGDRVRDVQHGREHPVVLMDERVGAAVRHGVCPGAALAAQAEAVERHPGDPMAALATLDRLLAALDAPPEAGRR